MCNAFGWPKPTGPYKVGLTTWTITDPSRLEPFQDGAAAQGLAAPRQFMSHVWYPAQPGPKDDPLGGNVAFPEAGVWHPKPKVTLVLRQGPLPATLRQLIQRFDLPGLAYNQVTFLRTYSYPEAPVAESAAPFPVLVFSHDYWLESATSHTQLMEELASHGYVVVAMDHTDCWATEFPDGRYLAGNHSGDVWGRLKDMTFLLDELAVLNTGDPLFAGRLDLDRIGVSGGSYGGMVVETCRSDSRVKCAGLYDATNVRLHPAGLQKPFLVALGESNYFYSDDQWLFSKATTNAVWLQIRGANHYTPCDFGWTVQIPWGRKPALAMDACYVWFFDTYLKGETPPFPTNPEIYSVQRK